MAPYGFAEALSKCVQVHVWPNNVSVTSPGVQVRGVAGTWQGCGAHVLQWTQREPDAVDPVLNYRLSVRQVG